MKAMLRIVAAYVAACALFVIAQNAPKKAVEGKTLDSGTYIINTVNEALGAENNGEADFYVEDNVLPSIEEYLEGFYNGEFN